MFIIRKLLPLLAVFFLISFDNVGNLSADDEPCYGDAFVSASIADARTLIPILASDSASGDIVGLVFNGLVKYDRDIELVSDLAESWEILDDGLTIVFHLRRDVSWHDGVPFTAEDVEFTYQQLIDPEVPTPYGGDFKKIALLEVIDDYTVKVRYREPFAPGLASWGMSIMPKHLLKSADLMTTSFARNPVGTGPYKFKRWHSGEIIRLDSNHQYFEHRPWIDLYIYRIILFFHSFQESNTSQVLISLELKAKEKSCIINMESNSFIIVR